MAVGGRAAPPQCPMGGLLAVTAPPTSAIASGIIGATRSYQHWCGTSMPGLLRSWLRPWSSCAVAAFVLRALAVVVFFACAVVVVVFFGGMAKPHIQVAIGA